MPSLPPSAALHIGNPSARDLRIDFFRGLALLWIFLNHIPGNAFSWLTSRNYGLSDATEIFVFLAGVSCAMAYGKRLDQDGFAVAWKAGGWRAFSIYRAHLVTAFVLLGLSLSLALTTLRGDYLAYNLFGRLVMTLQDGDLSAMTGLFMLTYRPMNMDVLPLYVVLLGLCAPLLVLARRFPLGLLAGSIAIWSMARQGWNLPDIRPDHGWVFNPFAWQLLFVLGILTAFHGQRIRPLLERRSVKFSALIVLAACSFIVLSWHAPAAKAVIPVWVAQWIYPLSKMNLDFLRLIHFGAVLALLIPILPASAAWLKTRFAAMLIQCGRHSLAVFSVGTILSFLGHVVLTELGGGLALEGVLSAAGCAILVGQAAWLEWRGRQKKGAQNTSGRTLQGVAG